MAQTLSTHLKELGFKTNEIKVYIALTKLGESVASNIAKKCSLPRTTVISILERLEDDGFISSHKYKGVEYHWVESPHTLKEVFQNKVSVAEDLEKILTNLYRSDESFPYSKVYDMKKSIKTFMEKILLNAEKKSVIKTIDSPHLGNYNKIFPEDFNRFFLETKRKRMLVTHTLIPYGSFHEIDEKKLKSQQIIIKELPRGIDFKASIWILPDQLVLFSGKPPFVVSIHHKIILASLASIYEYFWKISDLK